MIRTSDPTIYDIEGPPDVWIPHYEESNRLTVSVRNELERQDIYVRAYQMYHESEGEREHVGMEIRVIVGNLQMNCRLLPAAIEQAFFDLPLFEAIRIAKRVMSEQPANHGA